MSSTPGPLPLVTVLLPVHNAAAHLKETLASISAQSFTDFEIIAIDDGSSDGSSAILASHDDSRLRIIQHGANQGLVASLNEGLGQARGRYIARIDADDLMLADRLMQQVEWLEAHPEVAVLATCVELMDTDGEPCGAWSTDQDTITEEAIRLMLPRTNCIAHPSLMIRRETLGALRYDPRQKGAEDWDLWLRLMARGARIAKLPEPLTRYRVHSSSIMAHDKRTVPLELRLLRARNKFIVGELRRLRFGRVHAAAMAAQVRTLGGWGIRGSRALLRDAYRCATYSPLALLCEWRQLRTVLRAWDGGNLLLFPYMGVGGAERVHAAIGAAVKDRAPLTVIFGSKADHGLEPRFRANGPVIEIPRLLHHPFTRGAAHRLLAEALNRAPRPVLLASLSAVFFDLLPLLKPEVRAVYLQHAFLHQPQGNAQWRGWLPLVPRIDALLFVSRQAMHEFDRFLLTNNVGAQDRGKLRYMPNGVARFAPPKDHDRIGLLFVGRDSEEKRLHLFMNVCERLHGLRPGAFRFTAAGPGPRKSTAPIAFIGAITDADELGRVYEEHDALLLTSAREGFPMAIMEAMSHGLAIVSTPVGDVPNRVDASFAILSKGTEPDVLVDSFVRAILDLEDARDRLIDMRRAAYAKALSDFAPEAFAQRYQDLFREMSGAA